MRRCYLSFSRATCFSPSYGLVPKCTNSFKVLTLVTLPDVAGLGNMFEKGSKYIVNILSMLNALRSLALSKWLALPLENTI